MESTEMFEQIERLVSLARAAQEAINSYTQEEIDQVCLSVAWQVYKDENIKQLATLLAE
jgi:sulfoacetaldehyde dehydrogenase